MDLNALPTSEEVSFSFRSKETLRTYSGKLKIKLRFSRRDIGNRDAMFRQMIGGGSETLIGVEAFGDARIISHLSVSILDPVPEFLKASDMGRDLEERDVLVELDRVVRKVQEDHEKELAQAVADAEKGLAPQ